MLPAIMAIISLAQQKAQAQNQAAQQLNQNRVGYNVQAQQFNMNPMQSNGLGSALGSISSIYGNLK